jgi:hypothetical protein
MADQFGNYLPNPGNPFLGYPLTVPSTAQSSSGVGPPAFLPPPGTTLAWYRDTNSGRNWQWTPTEGWF